MSPKHTSHLQTSNETLFSDIWHSFLKFWKHFHFLHWNYHIPVSVNWKWAENEACRERWLTRVIDCACHLFGNASILCLGIWETFQIFILSRIRSLLVHFVLRMFVKNLFRNYCWTLVCSTHVAKSSLLFCKPPTSLETITSQEYMDNKAWRDYCTIIATSWSVVKGFEKASTINYLILSSIGTGPFCPSHLCIEFSLSLSWFCYCVW